MIMYILFESAAAKAKFVADFNLVPIEYPYKNRNPYIVIEADDSFYTYTQVKWEQHGIVGGGNLSCEQILE